MSGIIMIREIIRNKDGRVIDTVCDMDGFRGHMDPKSLISIWEKNHSAVPNIHELMVMDDE